MLSLLPTEHWDYRFADMIGGMRTALAPRHSAVESHIDIPGLGSCLPVRSARAAIVIALKALALPPYASVGVPLYCCPVVFKAINAAGCQARFIDVDPDTYCLSATDLAAKSSELDAVIAVHMFGNVCDMPALREAAPGIPFIEDCAQALGSRLYGRQVGSFGEIAAFSFRSGKYISVGEGGAVYCSEIVLQSRLSKLITELPIPSQMKEWIHVAKTWLRSLLRRKPLWGLLGRRLWSAYSENVTYTSQAPLVLERIYKSDLEMTIRRLAILPSQIENQRRNTAYYSRNLRIGAGLTCSEKPGAYYNRLQYPLLLASSDECDRLAEYLLQNQISTARPYKDIAAIATTHYGYTGDCPQAERIAKTVLVIPCNYGIGNADVERITSCVNRAWAEITCRQSAESAAPIHSNTTTLQTENR
jgi:perosamine synthetase